MSESRPPPTGWRSGRSAWLQWAALLATSALAGALLRAAHLPAAGLLGPMAGGIVIAAAARGSISVPRWPFVMAQGVIGGMIARSFTPPMLSSVGRAWKLDLVVTLGVLGASTLLGWALARLRVLPGTTAVWGSSPGAATSMVVMAEEFGADARLVAMMQYLRVVVIALIASIVARFVVPAGAAVPSPPPVFGPVALGPFAVTVGIVAGGALLGQALRVPAGALLVPFLVASTVNLAGWLTPELPPWLLLASYAVLGWAVGLRFTRPILIYAARALPRVLAAILMLVGICGLIGLGLVRFGGIDPLTAYLATSPGGADSAAIIAASSGTADPLFVMTLQILRAIATVLLGPLFARFVARRLEARATES